MQSDAAEAALGLLGLTGAFPSPSATTTTIPAKRKQPPPSPHSPSSRDGHDSQSSDTISCICGFTYDDGFSIGCDSCARWVHAACFSIVEHQVPDEWYCWVCEPRPVDRDRAVKLQKARQRQAVAQASANAPTNSRRRASPGVERKTRKPSALAAADGPSHPNDKAPHGNKRKRRASTSVNPHHHPHPQEDEHVDIDEPWTHSYVPITKDIIPGDETRDRLRRVASDWRGVSAINANPSPSPSLPHTPGCTTPALLTPDDLPYASSASLCPPQISLAHLHGAASGTAWPGLVPTGNSVRPPSYAVHATQPIQSSKLIAPYPSTIIPTAMYLRDPLNAYAHLGMPKPYVHLFGPPLDVALDARITGDQSRFVRSGCRPNAILRPMFCGPQAKKAGKDEREEEGVTFGIFALRDLKANEEIVLGWEWDDDNVVHHLPALIQSPFAFPQHQLQHFRKQMTSMLHSLASTFTTCACGAKARDCVLTRIAEFVENQTPLTPSPSPPSQFTKEKEKHAGKSRKGDRAEDKGSPAPVDLGPLIGIERGFRTRERIPSSGGMGGVELVPPSSSAEAGPSRLPADVSSKSRRVSFPDDLLNSHTKTKKGKSRKGKARAEDDDVSDGENERGKGRPRARRRSGIEPEPEAMDVDEPPREECLPPKLRKAWIAAKSAERLREQRRGDAMSSALSTGGGMDDVKDESYFDSRDMPPPPVPHLYAPPDLPSSYYPPPISATSSSSSSSSTSSRQRAATDGGTASPSVPFSKLSLLSPVAPLPSDASRPNAPPTPSTSKAPEKPAKADPKNQGRPSQPPASDAVPAKRTTKPANAKAAKGKEKAKEPVEESESEKEVKPRPKPKSKVSKESAKDKDKEQAMRPSTPATEADEPVLQPCLRRDGTSSPKPTKRAAPVSVARIREKAKEKEKARSVSAEASTARSTATASPSIPPTSLAVLSIPTSPAPPTTTPVILRPELPPEPPDQTLSSAGFAADVEDKTTDAMDVDYAPDSSPKAPPIVSAPAPPTPPAVSCNAVPTSTAPSPSPVASPVVPPSILLSPPVPTARSPSPPPTLSQPSEAHKVSRPESESEPVAAEPAVPVQDVMEVDDHEADIRQSSPAVQPAIGTASVRVVDPSESEAMSEIVVDRPPAPPSEPLAELARECEPEQPKEPPPTKVKLSLKDFALRKKKQREEQKEREKEEQEKVATESPRIPMTRPDPDSESPAAAAAPESNVSGSDASMKARTDDEHADVKTTEQVKVPEVELAENERSLQEPLSRDGLKHVNGTTSDSMGVDMDRSGEERRPLSPVAQDVKSDALPNGHTTQASSRRSPTPERYLNGHKRASSPISNGRRRSPSEDLDWTRRSAGRRTPSEEFEDRRDHRRTDSLQAKVELLDNHILNGFAAPARDLSPVDSYLVQDSDHQHTVSPGTPPRTTSPKLSYSPPRNPLSRPPQTQPPSQEDGEIFSPPPPKAPPLAPRSHTPPTHPRSFYTARGDTSPTRRSPPLSARRPLHPTQYPRNSGPPRLAPSAPRALRESGAYPPLSMYAGQNAPYFAPRGPSADRDRERDRARDWGRDRGDNDRSWIPGPSRGRGRGTWGR
ncbi:hypothetical protein BD310DRAFT_861853 [Dichomitus squalens]|uniref:PHD-type domain-containing protein n=1 Tax=Dichomitus squalens TaxID=114155 RepID=A0A4Q9PCF5_9APHY|nr:hypothetical protein BD310DRAFT_861853 [Dichomitus squalens]